MNTETIIIIIALASFLINTILFIKLNSKKNSSTDREYLNQIFQEVTDNASKQMVLIANEKLKAEKNEIKTDVNNKKDMIKDLVRRVLQELESNQKKLEAAERDRIGSFRALKQEMESQKKLTEQLSVTAEGLKKVLSNNQLRGQFGEQVAEDLLRMSGFVKGTDYEFNKEQKGSKTRPDFAIFLPDGSRVNVDAKFPYNNLQKYTQTDDRASKQKYLKEFERDIKSKIKQVTTRDYINPQDQTVDFVILFIPNEMIFSFIYDKMSDLWADAMRQKVILTGPFSFTAILRMVRQAYENFKYQENAQKVISYIKSFEKEFGKYNEEFEKMGRKIELLNKQYHKLDSTRTRKLLTAIDKIKLEEKKGTTDLPIFEKDQDDST